jgi:predicted glycosyltransferase
MHSSVIAQAEEITGATTVPSRSLKVWIDLDNSPHVPFFAPIIKELEARGHSVVLTARDAFQTRDLAELHHLECECIGRHYGKNRLLKLLGMATRVLQLSPAILRHLPDLAVGHGSRAQLLLAAALRIPTLQIDDYEFSKLSAFIHPNWLLVPEVIPSESLGRSTQVLRYPGIKEDVYVPFFKPNAAIRGELRLGANDIVVTLRPPASEAHYHNPQSDELFYAAMEFLAVSERVKIILLPRSDAQDALIRRTWPDLLRTRKAIIPSGVVDGLNLIWFSDLVISGGGTMNREAAALGVPVFSIFRGKTGAVDRYLSQTGRLVILESADDLRTHVRLVRRDWHDSQNHARSASLDAIVSHITSVLPLVDTKRARRIA